MIYITGDTHADFTRFSKRWMERKHLELTKDDYIIVCGDFGMCWEPNRTFAYNCNFFEEKPYTVLWVQGNHENYDMIQEFAIEEWHGGKVRHIVRDKVILLERGQVFEIEGKKFFTFGGAHSRDISERILRKSWWPEELPTKEEMFEGLKNLEKNDNEVDYIITHCCATSIQNLLNQGKESTYEPDVMTDYLEQIEKKVQYRKWYFGHYHENKRIDAKHTLLYKAMIPLTDEEIDLEKYPKLGHPLYKHGETVKFRLQGGEKIGRILIVDAYGTFDQGEEPSYDIMVDEERCLYKHIVESEVIGLA